MCPAGYKMNRGTTATNCSKCDAGQFQDVPGNKTCKHCPIGYYQSEVGIPYCVGCIPGQYQDQVGRIACKNCNENTATTDRKRATPCGVCPIGWSSETGTAKCVACGAGTFGIGCKNCPLGYARKQNDNPTQCQQCERGTTTTKDGAATCSGCDLGQYGSANGTCSSCPTGQYQDSRGETSCKKCEVDTYLNEQGKSSKADCTSCPKDRSTGSSTGTSTNKSCLCKRTNYYQDDHNNCQTCPEGADCSHHDGISLAKVTASPGFWRIENTFVNCNKGYDDPTHANLPQQRCCPLNPTTNVSICTANTTTTQCEQGYTGTLCMACTNDYVRTGFDCKKCPGGANFQSALSGLTVTALLFSLIVVIVLCCTGGDKSTSTSRKKKRDKDFFLLKREKSARDKKKRKKEIEMKKAAANKERKKAAQQRDGDAASNFIGDQLLIGRVASLSTGQGEMDIKSDVGLLVDRIKVIYSWLQIFCAITVTYGGVPWPPLFSNMSLRVGIVVNLDVMSMLDVASCEFSLPFLQKFLLHMLLPLFLMVGVGLALFMVRCVQTSTPARNKFHVETVYKILLTIALIMYPGLCTRVFQMFKCKLLYDDHTVLHADYSVQCWQGAHEEHVIVAFVFMALYVVGFPLGIYILLRVNHPHLYNLESPKHESVANQFGTLFEQYEPEFWYYEVFVLVKKMLLTGAMMIVSPGTSAQLLIAILIVLFFMLCVLKLAPFVDDIDDWLSFLTSLQCKHVLCGCTLLLLR
jgi:hypothetical protein